MDSYLNRAIVCVFLIFVCLGTLWLGLGTCGVHPVISFVYIAMELVARQNSETWLEAFHRNLEGLQPCSGWSWVCHLWWILSNQVNYHLTILYSSIYIITNCCNYYGTYTIVGKNYLFEFVSQLSNPNRTTYSNSTHLQLSFAVSLESLITYRLKGVDLVLDDRLTPRVVIPCNSGNGLE